jgi:phage shock protein PspC (stress-responsive transcriptional regulator)
MNTIFDAIRSIRFRRGPQRILGGIAGGLASRFGVNVWLVRLLVLISFLLPVLGWILYALVWLLTPWRDNSIPLERMLHKN